MTDRVRHVQELRRSSAAQPIPGRRRHDEDDAYDYDRGTAWCRIHQQDYLVDEACDDCR